MTVYSISYDLHEASQDYEDLYDAIESLGPSFHALESTWLVDVSGKSAGDIKKNLKDDMDADDSILITEIPSTGGGRWAYAGISDNLGDWFDNHL